jgi:hypothetical protein
MSFIEEHFRNYSEPGLGVFACNEVAVSRLRRQSGAATGPEPADSLAIKAVVALAPFDLGVEQTFEMASIPSDIEGVDEVHVTIRRLSGAPSDWRRSAKVFINDIRRQFLVWRALSEVAVEHYREKTLTRWDSMPVIAEASPAGESTAPLGRKEE